MLAPTLQSQFEQHCEACLDDPTPFEALDHVPAAPIRVVFHEPSVPTPLLNEHFLRLVSVFRVQAVPIQGPKVH